jgi:hypothetical protein
MANDLEEAGKSMMLAWKRIKSQDKKRWADWMVVGHGLMEGRRWAMQRAGTDKPEGKGYTIAFGEWLARFKMLDMDKADRIKLMQLMDELPAIEEWRATGLSDKERRDLNHPTTVWRKWKGSTKEKAPKKRGQGDARARAMVEEQQARIEELEEERLSPDASPTEVADRIVALYPDTAREIAELILKALPKPTADEHARRMEAAGFRRTKRRPQPQPEA